MSFQDEMKQMFLQVAAGKVEPEEWEIFDQFARNGEIYSMELYDGNSVIIPLPSVQDSAAYEETGLTEIRPAGSGGQNHCPGRAGQLAVFHREHWHPYPGGSHSEAVRSLLPGGHVPQLPDRRERPSFLSFRRVESMTLINLNLNKGNGWNDCI